MPTPAPPPADPRRRDGTPARGDSPPDNPRVLAGRYRLDAVIGKGSMGTVWSATDQVLHRQVAIKEIDFPPGTPAAERAQLEHRTLREARAIAALSNPYVITLFDILTLDNGPVIVMELLHSRSLAEILRKVGRLPDGQAATVGVAVASGLHRRARCWHHPPRRQARQRVDLRRRPDQAHRFRHRPQLG